MAGGFRSLNFGFSLALGLLVVGAMAQAAEKVRFGTPIKATANHDLPFLAAEEKRLWKQNDLDVQWISFDSGAAQTSAVAGGSLDVAMTMATSYIIAAARGVPYVMVADLKLRNDMIVWVRADSPIRELKDLKGAKVGLPRLGAIAHYLGVAVAKTLGMEKDVKFLGTGTTAANIAALKAGTIDAVIQDFFVLTPLRFRGEVRPVLNTQEYLPKEWVDYILAARNDFVEKSPAAMRRAVRAFLQAGGLIMENPDWALAKLRVSYGYTEEAARAIYEALKFSRDGKIDPKGLENIRNFIVEYGLVEKEKVPPLEKLFTRKFTE